jgi:hypothetical protein
MCVAVYSFDREAHDVKSWVYNMCDGCVPACDHTCMSCIFGQHQH